MISNIEKTYIKWDDIENSVEFIIDQMSVSEWMPDIIIGIANGGVIPATLIAKKLNLPVRTIIVQLRDGIIEDLSSLESSLRSEWSQKRILFVDDINDTGATFNYIHQFLQGCSVDIKTAALYTKESSNFKTNFFYTDCSNDGWLVFPWER